MNILILRVALDLMSDQFLSKQHNNTRIIARLDVKGAKLIKGVHLEGLREVGDPCERAVEYYESGADEIIYMDIVASLYGRSNLADIVKRTATDVFIPLTVGGGVRTLDDVSILLDSGADKIAVNTAAVARPKLISDIANKYGSQCVVASIEAKNVGVNRYEAYTDCGRESSGLDAAEWVKELEQLGAGEILLTSIDREGTGKGYDVALIETASKCVSIPVIASGGYGLPFHMSEAMNAGADALAFADTLHFGKNTPNDLHVIANSQEIKTRLAKQ